MLTRRIVYSNDASDDLGKLTEWLVEMASAEVARRYIGRVQDRIEGLALPANAVRSGTKKPDCG